MRAQSLTLLLAALLCAAPALAQKKPAKEKAGDKIRYEFPPGETLKGARPADLFYFVHGLDEKAYVQLDSHGGGFDVRDMADKAVKTRSVDSANEGYAIIAELPDAVAGNLIEKYGKVEKWKVMEGGMEACSGKLGRPELVGFVIPHFGEVQEFDELKVDVNAPAGAKYRKALLSQARLFVVAPVTGCEVDRKSGFLWAAPKDVHVAGAFFSPAPEKSEKQFLGLTSSLGGFKKGKAVVDKAYAEEGTDRGKPPERREASCSFHFKGIEVGRDQPERSFCHVSIKYGSTFCGQGPEEALVSAIWEVGKEKRGPLVSVASPDSEYSPLEPIMLVDLFGNGSIFFVAKTNELSHELGLFEIRDGKPVRIKATGVAFNDCPC